MSLEILSKHQYGLPRVPVVPSSEALPEFVRGLGYNDLVKLNLLALEASEAIIGNSLNPPLVDLVEFDYPDGDDLLNAQVQIYEDQAVVREAGLIARAKLRELHQSGNHKAIALFKSEEFHIVFNPKRVSRYRRLQRKTPRLWDIED